MYPEHEKMKVIAAESNRIGDFLDWLEMNGMHICESDEHCRYGVEYHRTLKPFEDILADYFEIDREKIKDEKRQMLKAMQELNAT